MQRKPLRCPQPNCAEILGVTNSVFHLCIGLTVTMLQGCGYDKAAAPASQVAARVNGVEISVHRVDKVLSALGGHDPQALTQTRRDVLDSLIAQELAAQAGADAKLDRKPAVKQAIEMARQEVLARAWLEHLSTSLPKPDATQVSRYYTGHPELFAQRRVYQLQQIALTAPPAVMEEVKRKLAADAPLEQIVEWLQQKNIKYLGAAGVRVPEQIPVTVLTRLGKARDGETLLIEQPDSTLIVHIVASIRQPTDEATAAPTITRYLARRAWSEALATAMKRLKNNASITYLGEFAVDPSTPRQSHATPGVNHSATANLAWLDREVYKK